jgi:hypothetical protein
MNYWDSVGRWINTLLLFIVGVISFDTLFRLLEAQESNVLVAGVRLLSGLALIPFQGMFSEQEYVKTAAMAVLGYAMLVGISLAVLRSVQATRPARGSTPEYERQRQPARASRRPDPARQATAERSAAQRTAVTRPDPQSTRSATRKPATPKPVVRRTPTTTPRSQQPEANRNGRSSASQTDTTPQVGSRGTDTASKSDGARGREAATRAREAGATSKTPLATTEVKAGKDEPATAVPRARAPRKASARKAKPVEPDQTADD